MYYKLEIKQFSSNLKIIKCNKAYKYLDTLSKYNVEFYN